MLVDADTNFLYLSDRLLFRKEFTKDFIGIIERNKIGYSFLPHTKDIWAVDYMPTQTGLNRFIQFKYEPDYLQNGEYRATQTNTYSVCKAIGLDTIVSPINIDGGNIIRGESWVILTDKIFRENLSYTKVELVNELTQLFDARIIIIPQEPGDFTGHADGILRHYNNETVLMNHYPRKNRFVKSVMDVIREQGLRIIEIPYNPYENQHLDMAHGLYINYLQMKDFILLPIFEQKEDGEAKKQFQELFPAQTIETIDARDVSKDGGVLNCISWNITI